MTVEFIQAQIVIYEGDKKYEKGKSTMYFFPNKKGSYSSSRLISENLKEPPDTHHIISKKNAFGFKLLSTYSVLKQSFSFLQQK